MASKAAARRGRSGLSLRFEGDKELIKALDKIGGKAFNLSVKAARAAMVPVNKDAKQRLKLVRDTGALWKSIGIKGKRYPRLGLMWVGVGARKGKSVQNADGSTRDPVNYSHLVEFGFNNVRTGKHVAAQPWLRPALDANKRKVLKIYENKMRAGLRTATERARREFSTA